MKMKSELSVDPGGGVGKILGKNSENFGKKLKNSTSSDSDSGLSGTNGESGSDRESEQVVGLVSIENLNIENILPDDVPELLKPNFNENFENLRPKISNSLKKISNRKVPFMGLALRTNPDLSLLLYYTKNF